MGSATHLTMEEQEQARVIHDQITEKKTLRLQQMRQLERQRAMAQAHTYHGEVNSAKGKLLQDQQAEQQAVAVQGFQEAAAAYEQRLGGIGQAHLEALRMAELSRQQREEQERRAEEFKRKEDLRFQEALNKVKATNDAPRKAVDQHKQRRMQILQAEREKAAAFAAQQQAKLAAEKQAQEEARIRDLERRRKQQHGMVDFRFTRLHEQPQALVVPASTGPDEDLVEEPAAAAEEYARRLQEMEREKAAKLAEAKERAHERYVTAQAKLKAEQHLARMEEELRAAEAAKLEARKHQLAQHRLRLQSRNKQDELQRVFEQNFIASGQDAPAPRSVPAFLVAPQAYQAPKQQQPALPQPVQQAELKPVPAAVPEGAAPVWTKGRGLRLGKQPAAITVGGGASEGIEIATQTEIPISADAAAQQPASDTVAEQPDSGAAQAAAGMPAQTQQQQQQAQQQGQGQGEDDALDDWEARQVDEQLQQMQRELGLLDLEPQSSASSLGSSANVSGYMRDMFTRRSMQQAAKEAMQQARAVTTATPTRAAVSVEPSGQPSATQLPSALQTPYTGTSAGTGASRDSTVSLDPSIARLLASSSSSSGSQLVQQRPGTGTTAVSPPVPIPSSLFGSSADSTPSGASGPQPAGATAAGAQPPASAAALQTPSSSLFTASPALDLDELLLMHELDNIQQGSTGAGGAGSNSGAAAQTGRQDDMQHGKAESPQSSLQELVALGILPADIVTLLGPARPRSQPQAGASMPSPAPSSSALSDVSSMLQAMATPSRSVGAPAVQTPAGLTAFSPADLNASLSTITEEAAGDTLSAASGSTASLPAGLALPALPARLQQPQHGAAAGASATAGGRAGAPPSAALSSSSISSVPLSVALANLTKDLLGPLREASPSRPAQPRPITITGGSSSEAGFTSSLSSIPAPPSATNAAGSAGFGVAGAGGASGAGPGGLPMASSYQAALSALKVPTTSRSAASASGITATSSSLSVTDILGPAWKRQQLQQAAAKPAAADVVSLSTPSSAPLASLSSSLSSVPAATQGAPGTPSGAQAPLAAAPSTSAVPGSPGGSLSALLAGIPGMEEVYHAELQRLNRLLGITSSPAATGAAQPPASVKPGAPQPITLAALPASSSPSTMASSQGLSLSSLPLSSASLSSVGLASTQVPAATASQPAPAPAAVTAAPVAPSSSSSSSISALLDSLGLRSLAQPPQFTAPASSSGLSSSLSCEQPSPAPAATSAAPISGAAGRSAADTSIRPLSLQDVINISPSASTDSLLAPPAASPGATSSPGGLGSQGPSPIGRIALAGAAVDYRGIARSIDLSSLSSVLDLPAAAAPSALEGARTVLQPPITIAGPSVPVSLSELRPAQLLGPTALAIAARPLDDMSVPTSSGLDFADELLADRPARSPSLASLSSLHSTPMLGGATAPAQMPDLAPAPAGDAGANASGSAGDSPGAEFSTPVKQAPSTASGAALPELQITASPVPKVSERKGAGGDASTPGVWASLTGESLQAALEALTPAGVKGLDLDLLAGSSVTSSLASLPDEATLNDLLGGSLRTGAGSALPPPQQQQQQQQHVASPLAGGQGQPSLLQLADEVIRRAGIINPPASQPGIQSARPAAPISLSHLPAPAGAAPAPSVTETATSDATSLDSDNFSDMMSNILQDINRGLSAMRVGGNATGPPASTRTPVTATIAGSSAPSYRQLQSGTDTSNPLLPAAASILGTSLQKSAQSQLRNAAMAAAADVHPQDVSSLLSAAYSFSQQPRALHMPRRPPSSAGVQSAADSPPSALDSGASGSSLDSLPDDLALRPADTAGTTDADDDDLLPTPAAPSFSLGDALNLSAVNIGVVNAEEGAVLGGGSMGGCGDHDEMAGLLASDLHSPRTQSSMTSPSLSAFPSPERPFAQAWATSGAGFSSAEQIPPQGHAAGQQQVVEHPLSGSNKGTPVPPAAAQQPGSERSAGEVASKAAGSSASGLQALLDEAKQVAASLKRGAQPSSSRLLSLSNRRHSPLQPLQIPAETAVVEGAPVYVAVTAPALHTPGPGSAGTAARRVHHSPLTTTAQDQLLQNLLSWTVADLFSSESEAEDC